MFGSQGFGNCWRGRAKRKPALVPIALALLAVSSQGSATDTGCIEKADQWLEVQVEGLIDTRGEVVVELHPDIEGDYLDILVDRIRVPTSNASRALCLPIPKAGSYIVVVLHDRDSDKRLDIINDGFGFSQNPTIKMGRPNRAETAFAAKPGRNAMVIVLNYLQGFGARPLDQENKKQIEQRRRSRQRG
ncbi:MAG: DUF2141 domain-containing protein [Alphaproteobacteria bacterium]|nr:MAG: DUF2141 domain-containing protein [Alphaproteobacteria bacterium]